MKKNIKLMILSSAVGILLGGNVFAANMGIVDPQSVFERYPETKKTQQFLENKKIEMQKVLDEERDILLKKEEEIVKKGDKATEKDKNDLEIAKDTFAQKYQYLQQRLDQDQYTILEKLKTDIKTGIEEVAKQKNIDIIIDAQAVYYIKSGLKLDITEDVLKFLSSAEQISLD